MDNTHFCTDRALHYTSILKKCPFYTCWLLKATQNEAYYYNMSIPRLSAEWRYAMSFGTQIAFARKYSGSIQKMLNRVSQLLQQKRNDARLLIWQNTLIDISLQIARHLTSDLEMPLFTQQNNQLWITKK